MTQSQPQTHSGRLAVVTGAARGIGQALCTALAARGADVVGVDILAMGETGELVTALGRKWESIQTDITDPDEVARIGQVVAGLGGAHILVNNAAIDDGISWDELDLAVWRKVLTVDLEAPFLLCKELVPQMRKHEWGRIVNIASGVVMNPMPRFVAYRAAKMGLIGFSRALATEVGDDGITVNVVSPGMTVTTMSRDSLGEETLQAAARARAIHRVAEPDDIAGAVLFASSDDCRFVTGQTLMANGGAYFV
ncbi:SDR family NAD(P)-dependent oxidoreductase [Rhodococcus globerulus]|uniref:3-oxoacyl-[acyl-carrier-protein] reductase MabA n=1 Tax=Rhodococcus globerulus TaxID=33008 RepID=A0ABU4C3M5_RHOGO|nr:SDR family oxidoreductase [Rhodococcus globerulus]MDV6271024.1 SDR family oxidoreductase [Rhodococcus globerulus]